MFNYKVKTAIILGAGFSKCAEIPLQSDIPRLLLSNDFDSPIDRAITSALKKFLASAFYWRENDILPSLEDIFTMIDLSAGSGHNLGRKLTPKKLRAIRRMLIYRVFTILDHRFQVSRDINALLMKFLPANQLITTHFVVLNWDIALERHLELMNNDIAVDYCVQASPWSLSSNTGNCSVAISKVHGSSNWVYCDNCRALFYDRYRKLALSVRAGLIKSDFSLFDETMGKTNFSQTLGVPPNERDCEICRGTLGPHIATFSFKKSFRTHAFASSWIAAEQILTLAHHWIFIGYSLPDADYEFKHLLKTTQLKFANGDKPQKQIDVVLLNDREAEKRYRAFFGNSALQVQQGGLSEYVK